jgi:hypothetical protein
MNNGVQMNAANSEESAAAAQGMRALAIAMNSLVDGLVALSEGATQSEDSPDALHESLEAPKQLASDSSHSEF